MLSGVCPRVYPGQRVSMATSFCPDQPEVRVASATRSTLQPEVAVTGSLAKAVGVAHEGGTNKEAEAGVTEGGRGQTGHC